MSEDPGLFELEPRRPIQAGDRVQFTTLWGRQVTGSVIGFMEDGSDRVAVVQDAHGARFPVHTTRCVQVEVP